MAAPEPHPEQQAVNESAAADGGILPPTADPAQLFFKVANAVVGAIVLEAAKGAASSPLQACIPGEAPALPKQLPPCTPQKKTRGNPLHTPPVQIPQPGICSASDSPVLAVDKDSNDAEDDDDDDEDFGVGLDVDDDEDEDESSILDSPSGALGGGRSPATRSGRLGGGNWATSKGPMPPRPRRGGASPYTDDYSGSFVGRGQRVGHWKHNIQAHEARPPPPPPAASLKALPSENVQAFLQLVQDGQYGEALKALRKVRRAVKGRGCSKEAFGGMRALLHHLLEAYSAAGRLDEARALLSDMKQGNEARLVSPAAFNAVLRGLLARGAIEEARSIVRVEMPRLGVLPNEGSLNLLMDTAARCGPLFLDEAWDILEEMQRKGLRADKYTVSILTKGICEPRDKRRLPRGVTLVEHFLHTQPEDVDEVLVNSLLDVFCRMGDTPRLEATLAKMKEYKIKGSAVTYGTIVKAYGRAGNIDKVLQAWTEMFREGLEANAVTYGCMLDACVKCGHLDKALHVFAVMKERNLHRNTILYATLIKGFAMSKDPLAARSLHAEMVKEGVTCNVIVFNSLIDAYVRAADLQGAAEVLHLMRQASVEADLITFSTLIKGYCSNGELNKAMRLAEELQTRNLKCDEIVYNSLLEGCVKAGDLELGMRLFAEMRQKHVRPSSVTFSILVKLLARAGRLDLATHLVAQEMRELHGVAPNRMVWSCLVTCCVKARDVSRAALVLDLLDRDGAAFGGHRSAMYATVVEGCLAQGEISCALTLSERACVRAPLEEGPRGLLSGDLLRRVFEVGVRGLEAETRITLNAISSRLPDQLRASLEDMLARGSFTARRRAGGGRPDRDAGRALVFDGHGIAEERPPHFARQAHSPADMTAGDRTWAPAFHDTMPFHGDAYASAASAAATAAAMGYPAHLWNPAVAAAAAASSWYAHATGHGLADGFGAASPCSYGAEAYGNMWTYGYGATMPAAPTLPAMPHASWEHPGVAWHPASPVQASANLSHLQAATGFLDASHRSPVEPAALLLGASPPGGTGMATPGFATKAPDTPLPRVRYGGGDDMNSVGKAGEQTPLTAATTAGRSSLMRSPLQDDEEDAQQAPLKKLLFGTESFVREGTAEQAGAELSQPLREVAKVPLSLLLDGPPGLC